MRILGLVFAGTATDERVEMTEFVEQTLGLKRVEIGEHFRAPDGRLYELVENRGR
jgi:hypothetical protein